MYSSYKTSGIVLKSINLGEADKILTIFTECLGKVRVIAKGIRRVKSHMAGALEPFILSDLQLYEGKTFYTVTGAVIKKIFLKSHNDLNKIAKLFYLGELIDRFEEENQKSLPIFDLLVQTLEVVEQNDDEFALRIFEVNLLKIGGFWGDLSVCIHCKKKLVLEQNFWDGEEGGIICFECQQQFHHGDEISNELIKLFRLIEERGFGLIGKIKLEQEILGEAKNILSSYIRRTLEFDLKSKEFLNSSKQ